MSSLADLDARIAPAAQYLVNYVNSAGYPVRVTSVYRSYTEQLKLWNNRANNPYPVAPPGRSLHQQRRAFDVAAAPEVLAWMGAVWESWGGRWGGRFGHPDPIHFEV